MRANSFHLPILGEILELQDMDRYFSKNRFLCMVFTKSLNGGIDSSNMDRSLGDRGMKRVHRYPQLTPRRWDPSKYA